MAFHLQRRISRRAVLLASVILASVVAWSMLLYFVSPTDIVNFIGVENGYMVLFLISLFGGTSLITSGSYYATLLTLAAGGLEPILLGIVSGLGASFGDTVFYFLGRHGHHTITHNTARKLIQRLCDWLDKRPAWFLAPSVYVIASITPMPNDVLAAFLGFTRRSWKESVIPLVLGNITFTIIIASLGATFW